MQARIAIFILGICLASVSVGDAAPKNHFERDIAGLLTRRCLTCHSGDSPRGKLDLSRRTSILKGGDSGPAIVPGKPEKSLLIERVADGSMPPAKHGPRLTKAEVAALRDWVKAGARWPKDRRLHPFEFSTNKRAGYDWWSLQPVKRPRLPEVRNRIWLRNPIDAFVLAKLESKGVAPAKPAGRRVLIRRLKFDLLGLPPTPEEVRKFVDDHRPDAWSRLVERYLASPHYGERWARHWLDVVRFGESDGFEHDKLRPHAWRYRDYVIRAFNADKPYDRFVTEQLAGDAIRPQSRDTIAATGFLVAGPWDEVQNVAVSKTERRRAHEEEMAEIIGAVSQSFLGMTVHCARCHDHKFDAITQADYYRLKAIFDGVSHADGRKPGNLSILTEAERAARLRTIRPLRAELTRLETEMVKLRPAYPTDLSPETPGKNVLTTGRFGNAANGKATRFSGRSRVAFENPPFTVECWAKANSAAGFNVFVANNLKSNGGHWEIYTYAGQGDFSAYLPGCSPATIRSGKVITDGRWHYLAMQFDGKRVRLFVDAKLVKEATVKRVKQRTTAGSIYFAGYSPQKIGCDGAVDDVRISTGIRKIESLPTKPFALDATTIGLWRFDKLNGNRVRNLALSQPKNKTERIANRAKLKMLEAKRDRLRKQLASFDEPIAYIGHRRQPPETHLLVRGNPEEPGRIVRPMALTGIRRWSGDLALSSKTPEQQRRLKFAQWVTDRRNPLTARVIVNRLWQYHFGQGLVKTPSDFGFHGGKPSHPQLLDWLADELVRSGWSLKHIQRLILTSNTFRQSSAFNPVAAAFDAGNRLLWRFSPRRLDAETVRDAMLAVSGELNPTIGGPSFRPFKVTVFNTHFYHLFDSDKPEFNRRSLYRMQISTGRDPFLTALDCPAPSLAAPKRRTTITPLQALALMNNTFALRQAERFARRVLKQSSGDIVKEVRRCYEVALGRSPTKTELSEAVAFVRTNDLSTFCWVLLNSSEFLYVR